MPDLIPAHSPLMQPVVYQGQEYYTSQYFHQQYASDSHYDGKYRRHRDYLRMVRNIPAYQDYAYNGDVVEIHWRQIKTEGAPFLRTLLQPLFEAAGYQSLILINGTMQLAIANHLEDESSKRMAVTANTLVARGQHPSTALEQFQDLKAIAEMARSVMSLAASAAETRLIAEAAKSESAHAKQRADQAEAKVEQLLHEQSWMTIHQYVIQNKLAHQMPEALQRAYATYLVGYCTQHGYRIYPQPVAYQRWEHENTYYVGAIRDTLEDWLTRRYAQTDLRIIHKPQES
jgi:hypothetical protein